MGGIENSCNYFFSEVAHRLSTEADGSYKPEKGLETLKKYATMFGLDRTSGIEISEATRLSVIPIRSVPVWDRVRTSLRACSLPAM